MGTERGECHSQIIPWVIALVLFPMGAESLTWGAANKN